MNSPHILLVDDDPGMLKLLEMRLQSEGFDVTAVNEPAVAIESLAKIRPHLVVSDLKMDNMDGFGVLKAVQEYNPTTPVIIITAHGTIPDAVKATQGGVTAFLTKPLDKNELVNQINAALAKTGSLHTGSTNPIKERFITQNADMLQVLDKASMVADSSSSLLITGESGSGKEVLASAIHQASQRSKQPFIAVNCAAIPETLLESELFGHKKGAFTGATENRDGYFMQADKGTLFLDEIGDMPLPLQVKLLRVLQEKKISPIGANQDIPVDVRILSATHRNLTTAIEEKKFRADLYYRLNVVSLAIPPLASRLDDIPLLAAHFVKHIAKRESRQISGFSDDALKVLIGADWPGNVRQLLNVVEQCVILCAGAVIQEPLVAQAISQRSEDVLPLSEARAEFEKDYLTRLLQMTNGSVTSAAEFAGRNRTQFYKLLDKYGINAKSFKH